jgi:hypothetical protein
VENLNKRVVRVEGGEIVEDTGRHTLLAKWGI